MNDKINTKTFSVYLRMKILSAYVDTQFLHHFQNMQQCKFLRQREIPPKQRIVRRTFILSCDYTMNEDGKEIWKLSWTKYRL